MDLLGTRLCGLLLALALSTSLPSTCFALFGQPRSSVKNSYGPPGPPFQLCPSLPQAYLPADQLASKMADYFKQADEQIKAALMAEGNPGGAVLSFVYKDSLLWTGGYGSKKMNGRSYLKGSLICRCVIG